jgi:hypothetical protein
MSSKDLNPTELDFKTAVYVARGAAALSRHPWVVIHDHDGSYFACPVDDDPDYGTVVHIAKPPF